MIASGWKETVEKDDLVVLPLQPEEAAAMADFRAVVPQWFFAEYIMDVRRDRRVAGASEDGPELEIVTVTGGKSEAIENYKVIHNYGYARIEVTAPSGGSLVRRGKEFKTTSRCRLPAPAPSTG
ncbi:hypothetical protein AHiyo4_10880 [Arthrobacter sp. Hiyo4]|nr:hypothetical protein AHiyo4_10880 [Arthrobacter sp. Hiyo4]